MIIRGARSPRVRSQGAAPRKEGRISGPAPPCGDVGRCPLRPGGALARPACSPDRTRDQLRDPSVHSAKSQPTDPITARVALCSPRLRYPSPSGATAAHGKRRISAPGCSCRAERAAAFLPSRSPEASLAWGWLRSVQAQHLLPPVLPASGVQAWRRGLRITSPLATSILMELAAPRRF